MIPRIVFFALILCLAAPPAEAQWWPFSKAQEQDKPAKVFNDPNAVDGMPEKKWALDSTLNKPAKAKDVVINGVTIKGLTEEMMTSSYAPKSAEEIAAIATAHNSWQAGAMEQMEIEAQVRIAAAERQSAQGLKDLQSGKFKTPPPQPDAATAAVVEEKPAAPQIFNKPVLEKPGKVFNDYR